MQPFNNKFSRRKLISLVIDWNQFWLGCAGILHFFNCQFLCNAARLCHVFFRDFSLFLGRSRLLLLSVSPRPLRGQRGLVGRQEHLPWILHGPHLPRNTLRERHDRGISHHKYVFRHYSMRITRVMGAESSGLDSLGASWHQEKKIAICRDLEEPIS